MRSYLAMAILSLNFGETLDKMFIVFYLINVIISSLTVKKNKKLENSCKQWTPSFIFL